MRSPDLTWLPEDLDSLLFWRWEALGASALEEAGLSLREGETRADESPDPAPEDRGALDIRFP
jgi:hypothetical protein